jgi:hypothetical protein
MNEGRENTDRITVLDERITSIKNPNGTYTVIILKCLPDTIDPQEVKREKESD